MSIRDDVLGALNPDIGTSVDAVVEETGLERLQVANALDQMGRAGKCRRNVEGWLLTSPVTAPSEPATPIREPEAKPPPAKTLLGPKPRKAKAAAKTAPVERKYNRRDRGATIVKAVNGALSFSLTEARAIAIERKDGSGERALVEAGDALRLADFLALVRPWLEEVGT